MAIEKTETFNPATNAAALLAQGGDLDLMSILNRMTEQPDRRCIDAAIINSSGNAINAGTGNTMIATYIVLGGAGTTGNANLAASEIPCTFRHGFFDWQWRRKLLRRQQHIDCKGR